MVFYITESQAIEVHKKTIEYSGGGDLGVVNIGYLYSALEHIQNDDYYPTFEDKLVHIIWSINRNHSFSDGNKRLSITLGAQFLLLNGYLMIVSDFIKEMENISYHVASGKISKTLLQEIMEAFLNGDFNSEAIKLKIYDAIK